MIVVGGGLSGLAAAIALVADGHEVVLLEAQDRLGGRVLTAGADAGDNGRFDLGPTWCWPAHQPRMAALLRRLGLVTFAQPRAGALLYELAPTRQHRVADDGGSDGSIRVDGGMNAVIAALAAELPAGVVRLNQPVTALLATDEGVEVTSTRPDGVAETCSVDVVLCTLPPRLAAASLSLSPALPAAERARWAAVPTWMAGHAKFVAVYEHAFWRADGLSGAARSQVGPLAEVHDATAPSGQPALFGFVGVPAAARQRAGAEAITEAALAQFTRLFGEQAGRPVATYFKDWSADPWVATMADAELPLGHPMYGALPPLPTPWTNRLLLAGTEVAPTHGGYLEGALEAAERAVSQVHAL